MIEEHLLMGINSTKSPQLAVLTKISVIITLLTIQFNVGWAQEQFVEEPSKELTSFRFISLTGGVILLRATVDSYPDSLNFILDTGSGGISLDSSTVDRLGINVIPSERTIRGIAGIRKVPFLYGAILHLPGLDVSDLNFHVNDYEVLSYSYGVHIDGIIGYSFLSRYIVNINYDNQRITINSLGDYTYTKGGHILNPLFTTLPIQTLRFKDNRKFVQRFYFDTGAGLNMLMSEEYVSDSMVLKKKRKKPVITQAEGMGGKLDMKLTTIKEVRVGPYRFFQVPTLIFNDENNITSYPYLGGLIGNDLLRRFNVTLNYHKNEIHIIPNTHFRDLFDYTYSGLSLFFIDGTIVVDEVVQGSPADKAGFNVGDIVLSVNNDFSKNLQLYKNIIQMSTDKIKFLVNRNGDYKLITMKTISIL